MLIPSTYGTTLLILIVSMICWGSWANTQKAAGKWRFELYYFDYALGTLLTAILLAFTFGTLGGDLTFEDNILLTGKRQLAVATAGGVVFNLANMLLVAAVAVAGLAVAFPIAIGTALVIGVVWNYSSHPQGNAGMIYGGAALILAAILVNALAHTTHSKDRVAAGRKSPGGVKGVALSFFSGLLLGVFYPIVQYSREGELGLAPYSVVVFMAVGIFFSTFLFNLYFLNLPVHGKPISIFNYFDGTKKQHLLGILGGLIWCCGTTANFVAASAPAAVNIGPAVSYALGQGATLVSALWGLLVWKEFAGASGRVRSLIAVMLVLYTAGLVLVSMAPLY